MARDVFLAGVGESLLSSECSDPGLTPRRYYFSVLALRPKSCQHIFYPFPPAQYIFLLSLLSCRSSRLSVYSPTVYVSGDIGSIQGVDGFLEDLKIMSSFTRSCADVFVLVRPPVRAAGHPVIASSACALCLILLIYSLTTLVKKKKRLVVSFVFKLVLNFVPGSFEKNPYICLLEAHTVPLADAYVILI